MKCHGAAAAVAVVALATFSAARAQIPPRDEPVGEPVIFKTPPFVQPPRDSETVNVAPPLPPQLDESHPLRFPTAQYPSDPPVNVPRRGANNEPLYSGNDSPRPPGRWLHSMVTFKNKIAVFGGVANSASLLNDLWVFDYHEGNWVELESASAPQQDAEKGSERLNPAAESSMRPPDIPPPPPMARAPGVPAPKPVAGASEVDPARDELRRVKLPAIPSVPPSGVYAQPLLQPSASFLQLEARAASPLPSDLWVYDVAARTWSQAPTEGPQPPARWLHAAVAANATGEMLVFGGSSNAMLLLNDVWKYSFEAHAWTQLEPEGEEKPDPREGHAAVVTEAEGKVTMVVFGGVSYSYEPLSDMWLLEVQGETASWVRAAAQNAPPARWMHTMVTTGPESILVFGGCSTGFAPLNDLWTYSVAAQQWTKIGEPKGYPPTARWLHASAALASAEGPVLLVHGGAANNMYFDDLWAFYVDDQAWVEMHASSDAPVAREGHQLVFLGQDSAQVQDTSAQGAQPGASAPASSAFSFRATRRALLGGEQGQQGALAPGSGEVDDSALPAPFRMAPPDKEYKEVRGASRVRGVEAATAWFALFGGASERGLVASEHERFQTVS